MWSQQVFDRLIKSSHKDTTFATFSSSKLVKENIIKSGFSVNLSKGFGNKKNMLSGKNQSSSLKKNIIKSKRIGIIGAGLSGCSLAKILSLRGHEITIFDKKAKNLTNNYENPMFILYPRLSAFNNPYAKFSLQSYLYSSKFYAQLNSKSWNQTGVLLINFDEQTNKRQESLLSTRTDKILFQKLSRERASEVTGVNLKYGGLFFPHAGWINPQAVCKEMLDSPNISFKKEDILEIRKNDKKFLVNSSKESYLFERLCLCTSYDTFKLTDIRGVNKKRGQITLIKKNVNLKNLKIPICGQGYVSPKISGLHVVGSTYSDENSNKILVKDHSENITKLNRIIEGNYLIQDGWVGIRATTPDRLPLSGSKEKFFVNTGHGSRGTSSAPFCSQYIADLIDNLPLHIESEIINALSPTRFNKQS